MRYLDTEEATVVARFDSGESPAIELYDLSDGSAVALTTGVMTEIGVTGYYRWGTSDITTPPSSYTQYLWVATVGSEEKAGKVVVAGYPNTILEDTDELQSNQGDWLTATGFSVPNEYDAELAALQADLDNPDQYKADISALALETSLQSVKERTDNLPDTPSPANEYDIKLNDIQTDLDNPDQYKADISNLAQEDNIQSHVEDGLNSYNALKRTEATSDKNEILSSISSTSDQLTNLQSTADDIQTKTDTIQWSDIEFIKALEGGRWKLDGSQMIFYAEDNITEVARFNMFLSDGITPAIRPENIFERKRVI